MAKYRWKMKTLKVSTYSQTVNFPTSYTLFVHIQMEFHCLPVKAAKISSSLC